MIVDTGGDCGLMEEHLCFCDGAEQRTGDGMVWNMEYYLLGDWDPSPLLSCKVGEGKELIAKRNLSDVIKCNSVEW